MAEQPLNSKDVIVATPVKAVSAVRDEDPDEQERALARVVALAIPAATVGAAVITGFVASAGPAVLVLAGGTLLGTITLLWASLRTLGGDAPLPAELESLAVRTMAPSDLVSRKATILRALKDLEHEREIGKLDDADFEEVASRYRDEAKGILRALDGEVAPNLAKAEQIAFAHLKKRGLATGLAPHAGMESAPSTPALDDEEEDTDGDHERATGGASAEDALSETTRSRVECATCQTSNEPDAAFCKKCGGSLAASENHASVS